ncbi:MAG TPA: thioredoxin domain-containing protein [Anaerolineae bacterium]|nr:thioredoxin domain-containing protein [Anaerolineae bacterium]
MSKRAEIREKRRRQHRQRQLITIVIVLGAALILMAIVIWPQFAPIGDITVPQIKSYPLVDGFAMGNPQAPVVIEEFSDFLCSYCGNFHRNTLGQIVDHYVATGQVYLVFNVFRLRQESFPSAHASMCAAEQGQFWQYADILYANQASLSSVRNIDRLLETLAESVNLDMDLFQTCMRENRYLDQIQQTYLAGTNLGIDRTPSFLINGKLITGSYPFSFFQAEVDAVLSQAESSSP